MKVGNTLKDVYLSTKEFIKQKDPKLAEKIHKNFGFGIGCEIKETMLEISATNETKIEAGMVFHTRITFNDGEIQVAIGDSVHVTNEELEQLTENVPREYARISFTLEEDEDEEESEDGIYLENKYDFAIVLKHDTGDINFIVPSPDNEDPEFLETHKR